MAVSKSLDDNSWLCNNIFRIKYTSKGKFYDMIIDGDSCENVVSTKIKHDGSYNFKKDGVNIALVSFDSRQTQVEGSNLFMNKTGFEGRMKTSPCVFTLVVVKENEIINEAPLQVHPFLTEFADVIPDDIPPRLLAMRDIQHCIDFIQGGRFTWTTEAAKAFDILKAKFSKLDGYLFKGARLCIPLCSLREAIILEGHACGLAGHFGCDKTLALLREQFYYPKMEHDMNMLLERFRTCHIAKTHSSNAGLYTPLSVPVTPWEDVSLDSVLGKSPFEVVCGRNTITPLDLVHVLEVGRFSEEVADQSEQIKELHRSVQEQIIRHNKQYKEHTDKHCKHVLYREGDLVYIHLRKEPFLAGRFRKLKPRGDGPFCVLKKINDNAYKIELPGHYNVSATFNVADLSPYTGDSDDEPDSRLSLFQEGKDDADAVNERINVTNTFGAYFVATNF
nr:retrotransposon protein, putative, Ty3-gypsy subclass [Tanacetum cinerariifolium]